MVINIVVYLIVIFIAINVVFLHKKIIDTINKGLTPKELLEILQNGTDKGI